MRAVLCAALVSMSVTPSRALAQAPPAAPQPAWGWAPAPLTALPPPVDLLSTEPGVSLSVFPERADPQRDPPLIYCASPPCRAPLWPGRYQIHVSEGPETLAGRRIFETRGPAQVSVDPDTQLHRTAGLVMGIVGPVITLVGLGVAMSCGPDCERSASDRARVSSGLVLLLGGLTITPVGWVMFGTSYKPEVEVTP